MIQHLLKLLWKQRRQNAWIAAELFLVFLLLWYITDYFITIGYADSIKNAYHIKDTYQVRLVTVPESSPQYIRHENPEEVANLYLSIIERIRQHPQVEEICLTRDSNPYNPSYRDWQMGKDSSQMVQFQYLEVTPSYFDVFNVKPLGNATPASLKNALTPKSIVISRKLAETLFPGEEAKGKSVFLGNTNSLRVGDVCGALKRDDYSREERAAYFLLPVSQFTEWDEQQLAEAVGISIRVKPGLNPKEFIESFQREMRTRLNAGNFLLSGVDAYTDVRDKLYLVNGVTDAIRYRIAFMTFLVFNIFLGIIGTFWFRNEYRKPEIGLRLAVGSTRRQVMQMMIGEGWLLLSLVAIPAAIFCINFAQMELIATYIMPVTLARLSAGLISTYLIMGLFIMLGTWYPAYLSSRVAPADTLRNE